MKTIEVQYFALLREQRGEGSEKLETDAVTVSDLYRELKDRHGFSLEAGRLKMARNDEFVAVDTLLEDGDTVVFIPPVAGG